MSNPIKLRRIKKDDNKKLASIIRNSLIEFKANKPGTVFFDDTTDHLFEVFKKQRSFYFVALMNDEVIGGAGIYPTDGLAPDTCELVKMYLSPQSRVKEMQWEIADMWGVEFG